MSARSLAAALPRGWNAPQRKRATLFTLNGSHLFGGAPNWASLLGPAISSRPMNWARFWKVVTHCGPHDGVRWRTFAGDDSRPERVLVLDAGQEREWSIGQLLDQPWWHLGQGRFSDVDTLVDEVEDVGDDERLLLRIPEAALL
ncbi:MAG: hypothetical protein M3443_05885 [Actinomycetota bacterium]|nr:hypothetical protein [Actinomycetota bacterium]